MAANGDALILHGPSLEAQMALLLGGLDQAQRRDPALSPLYADLAGLPRALIVVGDIDPLRDDSLLLAKAITRAGGEAELALIPSAPHAVIHLPGPYADRVRGNCARWVFTRFCDAAGTLNRT